MQKALLFIFLFFFASVQQVSAHAEGLIPFLRINGSFPNIHPMQKETIIPSNFAVPEDIAKEKLLVNQEIQFVIDTAALSQVYPEDVLNKITYTWDFGDGATAVGTEVKHSYKQIGSKVLKIEATFSDKEVAPQTIEVVQLDILPNANYILAEPIILVNKKELGATSQEVNMASPIAFDVKIKNTPSAASASYAWDFTEGGTSAQQNPIHTYTTDPAAVTPVVKVTDKNGFVTYAFGILTSARQTEGYTFATNTVGTIILGAQALIVIVGLIWFTIVVRQKKHTKRS